MTKEACTKCGSVSFQDGEDRMGLTRTCVACGTVVYYDRAGQKVESSIAGLESMCGYPWMAAREDPGEGGDPWQELSNNAP